MIVDAVDEEGAIKKSGPVPILRHGCRIRSLPGGAWEPVYSDIWCVLRKTSETELRARQRLGLNRSCLCKSFWRNVLSPIP